MTREGTPDGAAGQGARGGDPAPAGAVWAGVDGSDGSNRAVRWAARYASMRGLPLQLVYIVSVPAIFFTEPMAARFVEDERTRLGEDMLRAAAATARDAVGDAQLTIGAQYETGAPAEVLIDCSEKAHLLVLGTRGHGELTGLIVGSVTRSVVGHAYCPTVVVPGSPAEGEDAVLGTGDSHAHGPVVVGVDGSPSGEAALAAAYVQAEVRGAELVAVHVWSDAAVHPFLMGSNPRDPYWRRLQRTQEAKLGEIVAGHAPDHPDTWVRQVVERDNPVDVLEEWSERAQLVVIGTRGRGGFAGLILGSTSNALLHRTRCPLMVVRPQG